MQRHRLPTRDSSCTNGGRAASTAVLVLVIALSSAVAACSSPTNSASEQGLPCGPGQEWTANSSQRTTPSSTTFASTPPHIDLGNELGKTAKLVSPTAEPTTSAPTTVSGWTFASTSTVGPAGCVGTIHSTGVACNHDETTHYMVQVYWDDTDLIGKATVDGSSSPYDVDFTVPESSPGEHHIVLRCGAYSTMFPPTAAFTFMVTVVTVSLSPDHGRPGSSDGKLPATQVHIAGGGIACRGSDNTLLAMWDGGMVVARGPMTQPWQAFGLDFNVPSNPPPTAGRHTVSLRCATDQKGSNITSQIFTIDPPDKPRIQVSPVIAHRNDTLAVTGSGLDCSAPSQPQPAIVALFDGQPVNQTPKAATVSDPYDTFTLKFRVPDNAKPGDHTVNVRCAFQSTPLPEDVHITIPHQPVNVTVDPPSGPPGTPLQITATGVDCSAQTPTLVAGWSDANGANLVELGRLDSVSDEYQSYVLKNLRVPDKAIPGTFTIKLWCVWGSATDPLATVSFPVPVPKLEVVLSPPAGKPGDALKVSVTVGNCGASPVVVQWQGQNSTLYDQTWLDPKPLLLDTAFPSQSGMHTITAHCASISADATAFVPGITVNPADGAHGVPITVTGLGIRCASVQVAWDGQDLGSVTTQDHAFVATYQVPMTGDGGPHTVSATCPADPAATAPFRVRAPEVSANPASGSPSKTVTITGHYFPTSCQSYRFSLGDASLPSTNTAPPSDDPAMGRTVTAEVTVPDGTPPRRPRSDSNARTTRA
jgi:hypothetical protein